MNNDYCMKIINEEIDSLNIEEIDAVGSVPQQPRQPSDVQTLNRANSNASSVQKASSRINTTTEFPEAFRLWFQSLGYKPDNQSITIMKVRTEIERVMRELGFK